MKSGGGSGPPPDASTPQGSTTPYGQASYFNPNYQSFLPTDPMASAQLGDPTRQEYGASTPLLQQQQATPMAGPPQGTNTTDLKALLASLMRQRPSSDQNAYRGGSGSHGGGRG
jgi:hypothetical protein